MPIIYGMPSIEMSEESEKGKFVLGGCTISDESPKWHCQSCGHEFGKEIPSIEDLENPAPDGIKPLKLEFSIGGFDMPGQYCVKLEGDIVKYGLAFGGGECVRRQLSCPVGDNYLDRLINTKDKGGFQFIWSQTLAWKTYHSTSREFIYEQTSTRTKPRSCSSTGCYF